MAGVVQGSEDNIGSGASWRGAFDGQIGVAAAPPGSFSDFDLSTVAGRGVVPVVLVGPQLQLPGGVVPVQANDGYYSALQPRPGPGARRGVVLGELLPSGGGGGGAVYNWEWDYALQRRPGAAHGEVLVDQLPGGAFVRLLPGGVDAAHDNYAYYRLQPRSGAAGHGEVLVGQLHGGAGHGEVFVGVLSGGIGAAHDDYGYSPWQPRPSVGSDEVFIGPLADGVGAVFDNSGNFGQQILLGTGRADGIAGALRNANLGVGNDGSGALADDLGAVYNNRGMVAEQLRRLLPFAGIGASSVAINGLAAGPGSPAVAFYLFVLLLGGLFLVILHVLGV